MKGRLQINVETPSQLLGDAWRFEVRDARMRRVGTLGRHQSMDLDPGLYRVSGVLQDGREHEEILEIRADQLSIARFAANPIGAQANALAATQATDLDVDFGLLSASSDSEAQSVDFDLEPFGATTKSPHQGAAADMLGGLLGTVLGSVGSESARDRMPRRKLQAAPSIRPDSAPAVTAANDVHVESVTARRWLVYADGRSAHWVRVQIGDLAWRVSLPTANDNAQRASVELELCESDGAWRPRARIAPWRVVASSLQQLLSERRVEHAFDIADHAAELLLHKYQDPVGATLGALLLHRMRQLPRYRSWLNNLIAHFPWWPDAAILGALLDGQSQVRAERDAALQNLLAACEKRPCFTESYAHLLDGLRRWRDEDSEGQRETALQALGERYGTVDWAALTFTHID